MLGFLLLFGVAAAQQNDEPRGDLYSSKAIQALEQCFDSLGAFICAPAGGGPAVGGSGTLNLLAKWTPDGSTLGDANARDAGSEITLGWNNTSVFYTMTESLTAGVNHDAHRFDFGPLAADGSDRLRLAVFTVSNAVVSHTGTTNKLTAITIPTYSDSNANIDQYALELEGGAGWDADIRFESTASVGRVSSRLGMSFDAIAPPVGLSADVYDFTATLAAMNGSDLVTLLDLDLVNANHTGAGNELRGLNLDDITGDADATENAIVVGSGWDTFLVVDGATPDANTISFVVTDPTSAHTQTFLNSTGTVPLLETLNTWTLTQTFDGVAAVFNGEVRISVGSVADPDWSFQTDENSGWVRLGEGGIVWSSNAANRFQLFDVPAAGADGDLMNLIGAINAMNGADTVTGLKIDFTNANHTGTGNVLQGFNVGPITGDADAEEEGIVVGAGWDSDIRTRDHVFDIQSSARPNPVSDDVKVYVRDDVDFVGGAAADCVLLARLQDGTEVLIVALVSGGACP